MIKAINPYMETEYVSWTERHLPVEEQTVFILQHPDLDIMEEIDNDSVKLATRGNDQTTQITTGTQRKKLLLRCIKGWRNLKENKDGNLMDVPFLGSTPSDLSRSISRIPAQVRDEIFNELRGNIEANQSLINAAKEKGVQVE